MKKLIFMAFGIGAALIVERQADKLGISPKAVVLGTMQHWLNRLSGRKEVVLAEPRNS